MIKIENPYKHTSTIEEGKRKLLLAHRVIMEEYLGRELTKDELVHHKDGDTLNNSIENLEVVSRSEHMNMHIPENVRKLREGLDAQNLAYCHRCLQFLPKDQFHKHKVNWNGLRSVCKKCRQKAKNKTDATHLTYDDYCKLAVPCEEK